MPEELPPTLQRLKKQLEQLEQYLAYIREPKFGFANAVGAADKLKEYAEHFEQTFLKGQTAVAAMLSATR